MAVISWSKVGKHVDVGHIWTGKEGSLEDDKLIFIICAPR